VNAPQETLDSIVRRLLEQTAPSAPETVEIRAVRSSPRSTVLRLRLEGTWWGGDRLIAKQAVGDGATERFGRELVALRLLAKLDLHPPVAPKLLAWDSAARLILLEDLGDRSLATALLGKERAAAHEALVDYAAALGRLHAGTVGQEACAHAIRQELAMDFAGAANPRKIQSDGGCFRRLCEAAGVAVNAGFDDDVQRIQTLLATPGPFHALTHGDPCPDNERRTVGGSVFFDFEASGFDHALIDAAYLVMASPTCWCVGNLSAEVLSRALAVYRQTLATGVPEAEDDATFARHLLHASARWLLDGDTLVPRAQRGDSKRFMELLAADWPWGCSTARQRLLHRFHAFIQLAESVGELRGLTATTARLHRALVSRWPSDVHRLSDYPAFVDN
jgi:hypothetical protein